MLLHHLLLKDKATSFLNLFKEMMDRYILPVSSKRARQSNDYMLGIRQSKEKYHMSGISSITIWYVSCSMKKANNSL